MTNVVLNVIVLTVLGVVCAPVLRRLRGWPLVWTVVHLVVLTLVFDTFMIDVGLYAYAPAKILGVYVWGAPVEDFAYPVAAGLAIPVLWTVLGRRGGPVGRSGAGRGSGAQRGPADEPGAPDGTDA